MTDTGRFRLVVDTIELSDTDRIRLHIQMETENDQPLSIVSLTSTNLLDASEAKEVAQVSHSEREAVAGQPQLDRAAPEYLWPRELQVAVL